MKVLDLFCGAGGAAMGLHRAWPEAEIVGVDIKPMPRYPFTFVQADAMTYPLEGFDFIWASPPCQAYSRATVSSGHPESHPQLIEGVRARLAAQPAPWVMENVVGAPMLHGFQLCGTLFGLGTKDRDLHRHRLFEGSVLILAPRCVHNRAAVGAYGGGGHDNHGGYAGNAAEVREAMGMPWATRDEACQAVPPAYSEYIARQLTPALAAA